MIEELRRMKHVQWRNVYRRWLEERKDVIDTVMFPDVMRFVGQGGNYDYIGPIITITRHEGRTRTTP